MNIQKISYQYARPSGKYDKTRGAKFLVDTTWEQYFNAIFQKNYFTDNELEFLKALKQDLEQQLKETKENIKKLEKTR
jgi:hypothetical protein